MQGFEFREAIGGKVRITKEEVEVTNEETGEAEIKHKQKVVCDIENMRKFRAIEK